MAVTMKTAFVSNVMNNSLVEVYWNFLRPQLPLSSVRVMDGDSGFLCNFSKLLPD